jgi:uroporphyrinogen decarboxylase
MLSQNSQAIYAKTKQLVKAMERRNNFILSTACDLPAETPLKNIEAFMRAGREFGGKNG